MPYVSPRTMLSEPSVAMNGLSRMRVTANALIAPTTRPAARPAMTAITAPPPADSTSAAITPANPIVEPTARSSPPPIITIASPNPAMQIQEKYTATLPRILRCGEEIRGDKADRGGHRDQGDQHAGPGHQDELRGPRHPRQRRFRPDPSCLLAHSDVPLCRGCSVRAATAVKPVVGLSNRAPPPAFLPRSAAKRHIQMSQSDTDQLRDLRAEVDKIAGEQVKDAADVQAAVDQSTATLHTISHGISDPIRRWPLLSMLLALGVPVGAGWAMRRPRPLASRGRDGTRSFVSKSIRVAHPARPRRYPFVAGLRSWRAVTRPPVRDRLLDRAVRWLHSFRIGRSPLNVNRRRRPGWIRAILLGTPTRR